MIPAASLVHLYDVAGNLGLLQVSSEEKESWIDGRSRGRCLLAMCFVHACCSVWRKGLATGRSSGSWQRVPPTVSKWKSRFEQAGIEGQWGQHRGCQPRTATPAVQARILRRAQKSRLTAARGCVSRGREDRNSGAGSAGPSAWARGIHIVAESGRTLVRKHRVGCYRAWCLHFGRRPSPQADEVHSRLRSTCSFHPQDLPTPTARISAKRITGTIL